MLTLPFLSPSLVYRVHSMEILCGLDIQKGVARVGEKGTDQGDPDIPWTGKNGEKGAEAEILGTRLSNDIPTQKPTPEHSGIELLNAVSGTGFSIIWEIVDWFVRYQGPEDQCYHR